MRINTPLVLFGATMLSPCLAQANTTLSALEQRLKMIEQRTQLAEERAQLAEKKAQLLEEALQSKQVAAGHSGEETLTHSPAKATIAQPSVLPEINGEYGKLKLYGEVELDNDIASKKGQLTSVRLQAGKKTNYGDTEKWATSGRVKIGLDGEHQLKNSNYAGFSVQPVANIAGRMEVDDAAFYFGQKDQWQVKTGRYLAYNMFPLNQETYVEYSGNTANDIYEDGFGYIYVMGEGKGRSSNGGGIMFNTTLDDFYFETNMLIEDGTGVFKDKNYHGRLLENKKNAVYARPVIEWKKDNFKIAAAMESNLVNNAYGYTDTNGNFINQSKRNGYGLTVGWDNTTQDPDNGFIVNWNTAFLDAKNETDFSSGINAFWRKFQLGYVYAQNNIKEYALNSSTPAGNEAIFGPGKYNIHTVYTSYRIPQILDIENFDIYLGSYYSTIRSHDIKITSDSRDRYGARVKFKYTF